MNTNDGRETDSYDALRSAGERVMADSSVSFVTSSGVRTEVLLAIAEDGRSTDALLDSVEASESAVYNALSALERRVLATKSDGEWSPTGKGQLVATLLDAQRDLESTLESEYWETHDVSLIPARFRVRMGELAHLEVIRADDSDPYGVVREVRERLGNAENLEVLTPLYQPDYVESMPDAPGTRLLLHTSVLETALESGGDAVKREFDHTEARFLDVNLALSVSEESMLLSLPTTDGEYDARTTIVDESDSGVAWGRDLFEHYWQQATPAADVLAQYDL